LLQSRLRLGVPEGVKVTGVSPGGVYVCFILMAIPNAPKQVSRRPMVNSTHHARISGSHEAFVDILKPSVRAFSRGCDEFQGNRNG
jgi:hypothetical protein